MEAQSSAMPVKAPVHRPVVYTTPKPEGPRTERLRGRPHARRIERLYRRNPLCVQCQKLGIVREVHEWDHIIPLWEGGLDHEDNMQGLCKEHHDAKSAAEARRRNASKREAWERKRYA